APKPGVPASPTRSTYAPSKLLLDERYERRACCMHLSLVSELRESIEGEGKATSLCQRVLERLPEQEAVVVVASAVGRTLGVAGQVENPSPKIVLWLIPDPADIDCKQTTFVLKSLENREMLFQSTYKLSLEPRASEEVASTE
ncbi:unnamed protein product, partial [Polarella glacialis]